MLYFRLLESTETTVKILSLSLLVRQNLRNKIEGAKEVKNTSNGKPLNLFSWKAFGIHRVFFSLETEVYLLDEEKENALRIWYLPLKKESTFDLLYKNFLTIKMKR